VAVTFVRIDDRLIHGQVVEGWLRPLGVTRILVACDEAAADPLQVVLMGMAVPPEVGVSILTVADAAAAIKSDKWSGDKILLLVPGLREAVRLTEAGVKIKSVNLGGLHDAPGREAVTPSLSLNSQDRKDIQFLLDRKIEIELRVLPNDEMRQMRDYLSPPKR
jgi:mannose/fructose/N-acetylgalactosamine-specific phosphotransferase system component IIB